MKTLKFVWSIIFILCIFTALFGKEIPLNFKRFNIATEKIYSGDRDRSQDLPAAPSYSFAIEPIDLGGTIYDYMPGSYSSTPIRKQNANLGNGIYILYHHQVSASTKRKIAYSYINSSGELDNYGNISQIDIREGYPGVVIDFESGDPFVAYHLDIDGDNLLDVNAAYDGFNIQQMAGLWQNGSSAIMNTATLLQNGIINEGDQFIWPYVQISNSPVEGCRRIYISANNAAPSTGTTELPSENVLLAYADFSESQIENFVNLDNLEWHYRTIQKFDDWHDEDPEWARPFKTFIVKDNYVIYVGEVIYNPETSATSSKLFALVNDNYGEGDFTYYEFDYQTEWLISDIQKEDGSWLYGGDVEAQVRWTLYASWHFNAIFSDENTISFSGAMTLEFYDNEDSKWYIAPGYGGTTLVKEFTFNLETGEFGVIDVYPPDLSETPNNTPVVPWDLDGDGEIDGYDENGYPITIPSLPVFYSDTEKTFDYNLIHITKSNDNSIEAIVWQDCYEAYLQANAIEGYDDWAETSKIMIATKVDGKWRTPVVINAKEDDENYNSAIQNMIPCYVYPCDIIEEAGENSARLSLFFLNDDSYGSSIIGNGATPNPDNCRLEYAAIDFSTLKSENNQINTPNLLQVSNYPNPFNPQTTIKYNLPENGNVILEVFNLKGQKVKTLVNQTQRSGEHSVVWDGKDNRSKTLPSGIYFYKIKQGKFTSTKKMILMK